MENKLFLELCMLVVACAILAWASTRTGQPVILAYLFGGFIAGPPVLNLVSEVHLLSTLSQIGITLLLFLAGMVLHPNRLATLFKSTMKVTLISCTIFMGLGFLAFYLLGFPAKSALIAGGACMFSSTILVVKLLPTTTLHQRHMGSVCIAVLIAQDFIAVMMLIMISGHGDGGWLMTALVLLAKTVALILFILFGEQYIIRKMMRQADHYHEVLYMLCLGWCLGCAALASVIGLSHEIGAFIAGLSIARSPLSRFLTEELKPLRDFFLMLFFFALGAQLNPELMLNSWLPIIVMAGVTIAMKPLVYRVLFKTTGEEDAFAKETGTRLAPASEFGLIVAAAASFSGQLSDQNALIVKSVIILNMIIASWFVVRSTPTPLAYSPDLKQD